MYPSRTQAWYLLQNPPSTPFSTPSNQPNRSPNHNDQYQNGNYPNPPPIKRQFRDPYADWWDKQERRNYGEPVNEDNDILGIFSTDPYPHFTPGWGAVLLGSFVATVGALMAVVSVYYPDKPSVPRTFGADGLEVELGGKGALLVSFFAFSSSPSLFFFSFSFPCFLYLCACWRRGDGIGADGSRYRRARMARTSGRR